MKNFFPLFSHHPKLVYLDSASTTQKPKTVIDAVQQYLCESNSNIHRGAYAIAAKSEEIYRNSKKAYADLINAKPNEIVYTYNATSAFNMVAQSLFLSGKIKKGDSVLLPLREHHANIVPRQMVAQQHGIIIDFIDITDDYDIDRDDFETKYNDQVKVVAMSACSNVTGTIIDVQKAKKILGDDTILIVDGSQLLGKRVVDVQAMGADIMIATAHKMYAMTGLGMLYIRQDLMRQLTPPRGGGAMIQDVTTTGFTYKTNREGREAGTPHIAGAVSLLAAINFVQHISLEAITQHDQVLSEYFLSQYASMLEQKYMLIGKFSVQDRVALYSMIPREPTNITQLGEELGLQNIAIRTGGHCTHPYRHAIETTGSLRCSMALYNDTTDIDALCFALQG